MKKSRVSVIIPCYNVEQYIDRCLDSIIYQTYGLENLEIICIDDISTDGTYSKLQEYQSSYSNIKAVLLESKGLCGGARNKGLDMASGEYIMFVDADDYLHLDMIEKMYQKSSEFDCDMVQCSPDFVSDKRGPNENAKRGVDKFWDLTDDYTRKDFILNHYFIYAWGRLYKHEFIKKYHHRFVAGRLFEDVHFTAMGLFTLNRVYYLADSLYCYYDNCDSIIRSNYAEAKELSVLSIEGDIRDDLTRLMLLDMVKNQFWEEYQFFIYNKVCWDTMNRILDLKERMEGRLSSHIKSIFPTVFENVYVNSIEWDRYREVKNDLEKGC